MTDMSSPIELEGFERVDAAPGTVLLRIRIRAEDPAALAPTATLVVGAADDQQRVEPLPAPPDPPGTLRLAFPTSARMLSAHATYALEFADGSHFELPPPQTREQAALAEARAAAASLAAAADEAEARALALEQVVREESERREQLAEDVRALTEQLEAESRTADAIRAASLLEVERARAELESARTDAERAREKLSKTREALWKAQEELRAARGELDNARLRPFGDDEGAQFLSPGERDRMRRQRDLAQRRAASREAVRRAREEK